MAVAAWSEEFERLERLPPVGELSLEGGRTARRRMMGARAALLLL
jgi:hypothetical protein